MKSMGAFFCILSCIILSSCPNPSEHTNPVMYTEFVLCDFESSLASRLGSEWEAQGDDQANEGTIATVSREANPWGSEYGNCLEFSYILKYTQQNPYPGCSAKLIFSKAPDWKMLDLSRYDGIEFTISSSLMNDQITFGIAFEEPNGTYQTEYEVLLPVSDSATIITLPFNTLTPGAWFVENNMVHSPPNCSQCNYISFYKKGSAGEAGSIYIDDIKLFSGSPEHQVWGNPQGPIHSTLPENVPDANIPRVTIEVDCSAPYQAAQSRLEGTISSELYGTDTSNLFVPISQASSLGIQILRCGPLGSYNWRSAQYVGLDNKVHDGLRVEDLVSYARSIGAEPMIEINLKGWAPDENTGLAEACMDEHDAADLVKYLNDELQLGVKYFFMDNEFECWHQSCWQNWPDPCSADQYIDLFAKAALAMKAAQEEISGDAQDIQIIGPEISSSFSDYMTNVEGETYGGLESFPPYFLSRCAELEYDTEFNPEAYRLLDIFSFHLYPAFRTNYQDMYSFVPLENVLESTRLWWDETYANQYCYSQPFGENLYMIPRFNSWINNYYPETRLAVTEFGIEADPNVPYPQIYRVLYMSKLLGIMAQHGLDFAVQHCLSDDQYLGLMDRTGIPRPQYYPLTLYSKHFNGTVLSTSVGSESISAYACDNGEAYVVIMLVNEGDTEIVGNIQLINILNNSNKTIETVLPSFSLTCIKLRKDEIISGDVWRYGAEQLP